VREPNPATRITAALYRFLSVAFASNLLLASSPALSAEELVPEAVAPQNQTTPLTASPDVTGSVSVTLDQTAESTVFDLFISDEFKGSAVTSYTDGWCEIEDPDDAARQIDTVQGSSAKFAALLTGKIEQYRRIEGIGSISCDPLTFRIVVIPDQSLVKGTSLTWGRKLGDPESGFSLHQTFGGAAYGDAENPSSSAFTHRGLASYGDVFARANGFVAQDAPYQLNEATVGTIIDTYQARSGLLQLRGQSFSPSLRFAGLQFETAENLFVDNDAARGSRLEIFVPTRSTVRFFRESQLIAVQVLDFGLQEVDTSSFPQGSYDVDIIITDNTGRETRDRRFFTKAGFLASRARPTFSLSAGTVRDILDVTSTPIAQGGMRMRVTDFFDVGTGITATDSDSIGSLDITSFYRSVRFGLSGAATPEGDTGYSYLAGFSYEGFSANGQLISADGEDRSLQDFPLDPTKPGYIPSLVASPTDLYIQTQRSQNLNLLQTVGQFLLRYSIQRNQIGDSDNRWAKGFSADWLALNSTNDQLTFRVGDFNTDSGRNKTAQILFIHRLNVNWHLESQLMYRDNSDGGYETLALTGINYNSRLLQSSTGSQLRLTEEARRLKDTGDTQNSFTTNLSSIITGDYLRATSFVRDIRGSGGTSTTTLGLNAESTFLVANKGEVSVAFPPQNESVFVAEVEGNQLSDDQQFNVLVNGQAQSVINAHEKAFVSLSPYRTYKVSIVPVEGSSLVDYDAAVYEITLFPGNVVQRTWRVDKVFVLIGRLLDLDGNPIVRERIKGLKGYGFTEDDGTFQVEISGTEKLYIESKRHSCVIELELPPDPGYFVDVGDVVCKVQERE
jgi:hypothetical protein